MKNVFIIVDFDVHKKTGSVYSRIINYARALVLHSDVRVFFCSTVLTSNLKIEFLNEISPSIYIIGNIDEKQFSDGFFERNAKKIYNPKTKQYFKELKSVIEKINGEKVIFNFNSHIFRLNVLVLFYFKYKWNYKVFVEKNEICSGLFLNKSLPVNVFRRTVYFCIIPFLFFIAILNDVIIHYFDGAVVISTRLEKLYKYTNKIRIPILTELNYIENITKTKSTTQFQIGYTGTISIKKEGLLNFLKALVILNKTTPNYIVNFYGFGPKFDERKLKKFALQNNLNDNLIFHGKVNYNEVHKILQEQDLLILPRPSNLQTNYGFSTKLSDYLATGVAVLLTDTSDVSVYLKDNRDAFIIKNNSVKDLADKLTYLTSNKPLLRQVGENGKSTAEMYFHYKSYSKLLYKFIFNL